MNVTTYLYKKRLKFDQRIQSLKKIRLVECPVYIYMMVSHRMLFKKLNTCIRFVSACTPSRSGRPEARAWTNLQQQCQSHRQNWCVIWMNGNASPCQFELPPRNYLPLRFQRTCTFLRFIRKDIGASQRIIVIKKFY